MLCIGSADSPLSWQIDNKFISDYFDFCSQIGEQNPMKWKTIRLVHDENDGNEFSCIYINYLLDTQFFTVSHGKS